MNESKRNAKNKYRAKVEELRVELYPTDSDIKERIAERLAAGEKKASYIKRLIREDIMRHAFLSQYKNCALSPTIDSRGRIVEISLVRKDGADDEN